jgi:thioredoxin reductase (NADPH)
MRQQAERFGTQVRDEYVTAVDFSQRPFKIWTSLPPNVAPDKLDRLSAEERHQLDQNIKAQPPEWTADAVIISTGAQSIMLGVPGENELLGRGVSTCAVCDAAFYKEKETIVVGGGDSAMEDTLALTKFAKSVTVVHRRDAFRASKIMQDRVLKHPKVKVLWNTRVEAVIGTEQVEKVRLASTDSQGKVNQSEVPVDGVFIAIGHRPLTTLFHDQVTLDEHGYVVTRQSLSRSGLELAQPHVNDKGLLEFPTMTSVEGVFGAGDVVDVRYKQAITAAGQGCAAALDAERWLEQRG